MEERCHACRFVAIAANGFPLATAEYVSGGSCHAWQPLVVWLLVTRFYSPVPLKKKPHVNSLVEQNIPTKAGTSTFALEVLTPPAKLMLVAARHKMFLFPKSDKNCNTQRVVPRKLRTKLFFQTLWVFVSYYKLNPLIRNYFIVG